jgi:flagellar biosynthetic protein FliR
MGADIFLYAVQVAAPVLAALFFVEVVIALLAKTARQFNMLMLQFPIKILLGLIVMGVAIRFMGRGVEYMVSGALSKISSLLELLG